MSVPAAGPAPDPDPDLRACEREPIHTPGAIQPHGALLAALADGLLVSHASANLAAVLGRPVEAVLGQPLEQALGVAACRALLAGAHDGQMDTAQLHTLPGPHGHAVNLHAHRTGRHVCVDIEPMPAEPLLQRPIMLVQPVLKSFEQAASSVELCERAVLGLKAITGYDRVMAYRFGEEGHGEVIAEAREPGLEPFLGLRYPASDIPPQARQLYIRQRVGAIADASYDPVPLRTHPALDDGAPLDLTHSTLRSVSPVHCEYMRNMNTAASLTIGLVQGSVLWGMLVCHHATPRLAGPELRTAAGTIGQVVSLLLASMDAAEVHAQRLDRNDVLRALVRQMSAPVALLDALAAASADVLQLVDARGAVLRIGGHQVLVGRTPPPDAVALALARLQSVAGTEVLALDDLGRRWRELAGCTAEGSGGLLLPLGADGDDVILWFRPELSRTVRWGGQPGSHGTVDPASARISPRRSFSVWRETVSGRSAPWTEGDRALAGKLRTAVQAEMALRTKTALRDSEARLGLLAEHSGVVVVLSDLDGTRRYVSPASERVLGWPPDAMVGRNALEFIHPDDRQVLHEANKSLLAATGQSSASYRFRRPDGSWVWVDGHARLRAGGAGEEPKDYVVVLRDATERKAAEFKLLAALDRMEQMAATDGLTGLSNRRHLDLAAEREWLRCARERLPLSVLLIDADHFKRYNDRYGHLAGDDCLRAIAAQVAAVGQRPGDVAARYGGEEFVLLLPNTDGDGARRLAQRLCALVQGLGLPHEGNAGTAVVTVSIGVASGCPGEPDSGPGDLAAVFAAADAALYQAKHAGRNRVVVSDDTSDPA
jgi:diguanylate cyclase (GGDEF)-like protein/PAS domain S-box-containing protein